ncbi:MAG TPA: MFS transporter [Actinomycetota bacterium]|nr:MFS transporter [Actinomycetota bacterium]
MTAALSVRDLTVRIGETALLDGVSLEVGPGCIVAVVGPNGAGKTTLLDAISGVAPGATGDVAIAGNDAASGTSGPRAGVGRVFQGSPLPETLTVGEVAAVKCGGRAGAADLLARFGLMPHASSFVGELSTGMRRILDLAVATVGSPSVLLLDEPSSGLAQSEIEHLARLLRSWRDATGAAVLIVEHDASLVKAVADEVVVMDGGRLAARGPAAKVLKSARKGAMTRLHSPHEAHFKQALATVAAGASSAPPLVRRSLSTWTLLRLGLREFSAGLASVMILGVLNRVMKVELGISLAVTAAVLASYNFAAPFALMIGHRSDTKPLFGRKRTPYIVGGALITGVCVIAAPHVAGQLQHGVTFGAVIASVALFVAMGTGMYGSGTVFFALLADIAPPDERGHAASIVYLELMAGILAGVALTGAVVDDGAGNLGTLFALAGVLVVVFSTLAVWGMEKHTRAPEPGEEPDEISVPFRRAVRGLAAIPQVRVFFAFMLLSTVFLFLQQAVLEPFGGDVLGYSVRATSAFNAVMTIGIVVGMMLAGRPWAEQYGHTCIARWALMASVASFGGLAAAAATSAAPPAWLSIMGIGLATGLFNVAVLALMMGMADKRRTALFMGTWTVAHAVADGTGVAGGGAIYELAQAVLNSVPGGYATVFALEAVGLALCLPLLRRVDPERFAQQARAIDVDALAGDSGS